MPVNRYGPESVRQRGGNGGGEAEQVRPSCPGRRQATAMDCGEVTHAAALVAPAWPRSLVRVSTAGELNRWTRINRPVEAQPAENEQNAAPR